VSEPQTRVSPDVRAALLRKYRLLCVWRLGKDRSFATSAQPAQDAGESTEGLATRADLRTLSQEFPGALRELDRLGLPELERRVQVLAGDDEPDEQWIAWIASYHEVMRDELARRRSGDPPERLRPPEGKLSLAVLREVARRFARSPSEIATTLFPPRTARAPSSPL
jgi:hypothetical protein